MDTPNFDSREERDAEIDQAVRRVIGGIDWYEVLELDRGGDANYFDTLHIGVRKRVADAFEALGGES
jgi:hypothetical protein